MSDDKTRRLLDRFTAGVAGVLPVDALWAHGSLALGDYQPGRSDIDLVALISAPIGGAREEELRCAHEALARQEPLAAKLHCAYMVSGQLADTGRSHLTWAHGELLDRVVSPVTRRELHQGGLCLYGAAPGGMVPAVTDSELAAYVRDDLRDYWYPKTALPELWLHDIWVDLGMLTLARAAVTLADGRLITKREALEVLAADGAPAEVVRDIRQRRYESARPLSDQRRIARGYLARTYVRARIERIAGT